MAAVCTILRVTQPVVPPDCRVTGVAIYNAQGAGPITSALVGDAVLFDAEVANYAPFGGPNAECTVQFTMAGVVVGTQSTNVPAGGSRSTYISIVLTDADISASLQCCADVIEQHNV